MLFEDEDVEVLPDFFGQAIAALKTGTSSTIPNSNTFVSAIASTVIRAIISGLTSTQQVVTDVAAFLNGIIASLISFLNSFSAAV